MYIDTIMVWLSMLKLMLICADLQSIDTALDQAISDMNALQTAANGLTSDMNTLKSNIDNTKTQCASDCTPTTACDGFDTSQMAVSADFSTVRCKRLVKNVSHNLIFAKHQPLIFIPPLKKEGHIALHMSVGMSVSLSLVQLITQECFAQEASNLLGR